MLKHNGSPLIFYVNFFHIYVKQKKHVCHICDMIVWIWFRTWQLEMQFTFWMFEYVMPFLVVLIWNGSFCSLNMMALLAVWIWRPSRELWNINAPLGILIWNDPCRNLYMNDLLGSLIIKNLFGGLNMMSLSVIWTWSAFLAVRMDLLIVWIWWPIGN